MYSRLETNVKEKAITRQKEAGGGVHESVVLVCPGLSGSQDMGVSALKPGPPWANWDKTFTLNLRQKEIS